MKTAHPVLIFILASLCGALQLNAGVTTNTPPSFTIGAAVVVLQNSGPASIPNWATNISPSTPPGNFAESSQTVHFLVSNGNPALFSAQPAVSTNGTLTFTPASNACGLAFVTVVAQDDGAGTVGGIGISAPQTSTISVVSTSCPPVLICGNVVAECAGGLTPVNFTVNVPDGSGPVLVTCTPPSGTGFRLGTSNVTCTASSPGGTNTCSFTVTVVDTTPPSVTCSTNRTVDATGPSGAVVTYVAVASDPCGLASLACVPPSGSTFPIGTTTVTCRAVDNAGNANSCTFAITVLGSNQPPVCDLQVPCNGYVIALNGSNACVVLDGSGSSDPDGDPLSFSWLLGAVFPISLDPSQEPGGGGTGSGSGTVTLAGVTLTLDIAFSGLSDNATAAHIHGPAGPGTNAAVLYGLNAVTTLGATTGTISGTVTVVDGTGGFTIAQQLQQLHAGLWYVNIHTTNHPAGEIRGQLPPTPTAIGAIVSSCFDVGCYTVTFTVSDGQATSQCQTNLCVVSPCNAVDECIALVNMSNLTRKNKRSLIATLKAACASFERGDFVAGAAQLIAFESQVRAQIAPKNPSEAAAFIDCAQKILDAIECAATE